MCWSNAEDADKRHALEVLIAVAKLDAADEDQCAALQKWLKNKAADTNINKCGTRLLATAALSRLIQSGTLVSVTLHRN